MQYDSVRNFKAATKTVKLGILPSAKEITT
jgi:hypothetical protein